ncbi:MAG TPA: glycosyltransferase, partial [Pedobacter sp.]
TSYTIAKHLAKNNFVFYIENPFTWKDYLKLRGKPQILKRGKLFSAKSDGILTTQIDKLKVVITPPLLSINFLPEGNLYRILLGINESIIRNRIKKIIKQLKIRELVYINSFNFHYPNAVNGLPVTLSVYHCVDPLIVKFDTRHGLISEKELVVKSDLVICTSRKLFQEKKQLNKNTFFIPNAADLSLSQQAQNPDLKINNKLSEIKKPIIGYFGNIERRLDFDLLKNVITQNPDKSFVFVGPVSMEFLPQWFTNLPNVYMLGRVAYEELPSVLKGFDIALIPFKKDEVSASIFPLKLFEYLGAGKPVIATDFNPDLNEFTYDTVRFCKDSVSFSAAIAEELKTNSEEKIAERIKVAGENTWDKRASEFGHLLEIYRQKAE